MATLGTLAAGVAHELNNPAAATRRAADQLRDAFSRLDDAHALRDRVAFTPAQQEAVVAMERAARDAAGRPDDLDAMSRSDAEEAAEEWLEARGVPRPWELAPNLVNAGLFGAELERSTLGLEGDALAAALAWVGAALPVYSLATEIGQGSARISEIVGAMKSYSYLGQAPVQEVDLREGIDSTLVILRSKLKGGIAVHREYSEALPRVRAWGSELNQVWTNLIDNAVDAMDGNGTLNYSRARGGPVGGRRDRERRDRHPGRCPPAHPRSVLYDQGAGQGDGARVVDQLFHHHREAQGRDVCGFPSRTDAVHGEAPLARGGIGIDMAKPESSAWTTIPRCLERSSAICGATFRVRTASSRRVRAARQWKQHANSSSAGHRWRCSWSTSECRRCRARNCWPRRGGCIPMRAGYC